MDAPLDSLLLANRHAAFCREPYFLCHSLSFILVFFFYLPFLSPPAARHQGPGPRAGDLQGLPSHNFTTGYAIYIFSDLGSSILSSLRISGKPELLQLTSLWFGSRQYLLHPHPWSRVFPCKEVFSHLVARARKSQQRACALIAEDRCMSSCYADMSTLRQHQVCVSDGGLEYTVNKAAGHARNGVKFKTRNLDAFS